MSKRIEEASKIPMDFCDTYMNKPLALTFKEFYRRERNNRSPIDKKTGKITDGLMNFFIDQLTQGVIEGLKEEYIEGLKKVLNEEYELFPASINKIKKVHND